MDFGNLFNKGSNALFGAINNGSQILGNAAQKSVNQARQPQQQVNYAGPAAPAGPTAAQTDPLLASLGTLDTILANKNAGTVAEYQRAINGYNAQDALDGRAHTQNIQQNEGALTSGNQAALLNAANASTGLRGSLASMGALNGSGLNVVDRLVGLAANQDTGAARKNFDMNATNIGQGWEQTTQAQRQRREDAAATFENNKQNNRASVLNSRKGILEQLASVYGPNNGKGNEYAAQASALAPQIAETSRASVAPYQAASSLASPVQLQKYLAGTQDLKVDTTGGSQTPINSPQYNPNKRKDTLAGIV